VHLGRGLVGWSQVVWLGNGHKAVTVQGPRRPLLRSVLCSILILGLLPSPPVVDQPLTSSPNISNHWPKKTRMLSKLLFLFVSLVTGQDLNLCKERESHFTYGGHNYVYSGKSTLLDKSEAKSTQTGAKGADVVFLLYRLPLDEILMINIESKTR